MSEHLDQLRKEAMPFGKHKGKTFYSIPLRYFWWLLEQPWMKDRPVLKEKIEAFLSESEADRSRNQPVHARRFRGFPRSHF